MGQALRIVLPALHVGTLSSEDSGSPGAPKLGSLCRSQPLALCWLGSRTMASPIAIEGMAPAQRGRQRPLSSRLAASSQLRAAHPFTVGVLYPDHPGSPWLGLRVKSVPQISALPSIFLPLSSSSCPCGPGGSSVHLGPSVSLFPLVMPSLFLSALSASGLCLFPSLPPALSPAEAGGLPSSWLPPFSSCPSPLASSLPRSPCHHGPAWIHMPFPELARVQSRVINNPGPGPALCSLIFCVSFPPSPLRCSWLASEPSMSAPSTQPHSGAQETIPGPQRGVRPRVFSPAQHIPRPDGPLSWPRPSEQGELELAPSCLRSFSSQLSRLCGWE